MSRGHSRRTGLPEVIEQTAFSLKAGAHSGVVKSVYGWHVVKTAKMEKGKQLGFDEVKEKITEEMGGAQQKRGDAQSPFGPLHAIQGEKVSREPEIAAFPLSRLQAVSFAYMRAARARGVLF